MLPAGHRDPGNSQGAAALPRRAFPEVGGSSAQADPRPHCPPRQPGGDRRAAGPGGFLVAQNVPGLHLGESRIKHDLKLLYSLKRTDSRFLKGQGGVPARTKASPGLGGQVPQKLALRDTPNERSNLEWRCLQGTLKWCRHSYIRRE